jgi:hypothetical protein
MKEYTVHDLAAIRRQFDINEDPDDDAARCIAEQAGESFNDVTPELDLVTTNPLTVNVAATDLEFTKTPGFAHIMEIISDRIEHFTKKSENLKLSGDERLAYQGKALGAKEIKLAVGEWVAERRERLQSASTAERAAMGPNAKTRIENLTAESVPAPVPELLDNQDDLINPDEPVLLDGIKFYVQTRKQ